MQKIWLKEFLLKFQELKENTKKIRLNVDHLSPIHNTNEQRK